MSRNSETLVTEKGRKKKRKRNFKSAYVQTLLSIQRSPPVALTLVAPLLLPAPPFTVLLNYTGLCNQILRTKGNNIILTGRFRVTSSQKDFRTGTRLSQHLPETPLSISPPSGEGELPYKGSLTNLKY